MTDERIKDVSKALKKASGVAPLHLSGATGNGVKPLVARVYKLVEARRAAEKAAADNLKAGHKEDYVEPWRP